MSVDVIFYVEVIADVLCPAQSQGIEEKLAKREECASMGQVETQMVQSSGKRGQCCGRDSDRIS